MPMILDGHTHIFPEEVIRGREDFFADEPALRLLYESPKSKMVGPEEMLAAMEEESVEAAVILGFPWRREAPLAAAQRSDPRGPAPLAPEILRFLRRPSGGARGRAGDRTLPGRRRPGHRGTGLLYAGPQRRHHVDPGPGGRTLPALQSAADAPRHRPGRFRIPGPVADAPGRGLPGDQGLSGDHLDSGPLGRAAALLRPAEERGPRGLAKTSITTPPPPRISTGR